MINVKLINVVPQKKDKRKSPRISNKGENPTRKNIPKRTTGKRAKRTTTPKKTPTTTGGKKFFPRWSQTTRGVFRFKHDQAVECLYPTTEGEQYFRAYISMKICAANNDPFYNVYFPEDGAKLNNIPEEKIRITSATRVESQNRKWFIGKNVTVDEQEFYIEALGTGVHINHFICVNLETSDDENDNRHYIESGKLVAAFAKQQLTEVGPLVD